MYDTNISDSVCGDNFYYKTLLFPLLYQMLWFLPYYNMTTKGVRQSFMTEWLTPF